MDIAERVDRAKEGRKVVASLQNRIDDVRIKAGQRSTEYLVTSMISNQKYFA